MRPLKLAELIQLLDEYFYQASDILVWYDFGGFVPTSFGPCRGRKLKNVALSFERLSKRTRGITVKTLYKLCLNELQNGNSLIWVANTMQSSNTGVVGVKQINETTIVLETRWIDD